MPRPGTTAPPLLTDMRWAYNHIGSPKKGSQAQEDAREHYRSDRGGFLELFERLERQWASYRLKAKENMEADGQERGVAVGEAASVAKVEVAVADEGRERCERLIVKLRREWEVERAALNGD